MFAPSLPLRAEAPLPAVIQAHVCTLTEAMRVLEQCLTVTYEAADAFLAHKESGWYYPTTFDLYAMRGVVRLYISQFQERFSGVYPVISDAVFDRVLEYPNEETGMPNADRNIIAAQLVLRCTDSVVELTYVHDGHPDADELNELAAGCNHAAETIECIFNGITHDYGHKAYLASMLAGGPLAFEQERP